MPRINIRIIILVVAGLLTGLVLAWLLTSPTGQKTAQIPVAGVPATGSVPAAAGPAATVFPGQVAPEVSPTAKPLPRPTPPPGLGTEYLALGDSVAYGLGAPVPVDMGYAGIFYANYLKRAQPDLLSYRNLAVPGETSQSFLNNSRGKSQLQRALDELDSAAASGRRVSPITLTIGGNDMLEVRGKNDSAREAALQKFDQNFGRILDEIKAKAGQADLLVSTYYNPYATAGQANDPENAWVLRFNAVISRQAAGHGARVADFYTALSGKEKELTWINFGDIHPNSNGYSLLAQAVWKAGGYDITPPSLVLDYTPLPADARVGTNQRLSFLVSAQETLSGTGPDNEGTGAGSLISPVVILDNSGRANLAAVPARLARGLPGWREFSYILDTGLLASGRHNLRFEVSDTAGNTGSLDLTFEVV